MNKSITTLIAIVVVIGILAYVVYQKEEFNAGRIFVLSISTNGNYVITTDSKKYAILWNLKKHTKKILDRNANIYSAYFIKGTNDFMWQHDPDNEVYIKNTNGELIKKLNPGFPTYGQAITSDLYNYIASDVDWDLYKITNRNKTLLMKDKSGFWGVGKLLNLSITTNNKLLLISGQGVDPFSPPSNMAKKPNPKLANKKGELDGVTLWNIKRNMPIFDFRGNAAVTFATISPDNKYIVSGDNNTRGFVWNAKTGKLIFTLWNLWRGKPVKFGKDGVVLAFDNTGLISPPKDFVQILYRTKNESIFCMKFIDTDNDYLRFTQSIPYAILYSIHDPKPKKYIKLGSSPFPSVIQFVRDQAIDTAPKAHILIMGKAYEGGILVYKYDPKTQTLRKIWDAK